VLAWLSLTASTFAQSNGVVTGRVTDDHGKVESQLVRLLAVGDVPAGDVYTDSEGHYTFQGLPGGVYYVVVEAEGYRPFHQSVSLDMQVQPKVTLDVILEPVTTPPPTPGQIISGSTSSHALNAKRPGTLFSPKVLKEFERGNKDRQKGDLNAALAHYQKALDLDASFYPALNNQGTLLEREGKHAEAAAAFSKAVGINPDDGEAYINWGHVLYEEGQYRPAIERLEQGLKRSPNSPTGNFFLGSVYLKLQDMDKAESLLKKACVMDPDHLAAAHLQLANLYMKRRDYPAARLQLETYLRQNPSDPQAPTIRKMLASLK